MKSLKISSHYRSLIAMFYGCSAKKSSAYSTNCCDKEPVLKKQKNAIDWAIGKHESLVCTLTASKLAERKNELQKEVFSSIKNTKEIATGFIFSFPYDEIFLLKMTEYIITEKKCCPFFNFVIKLHPTNDMVLEITGPIEAKEMLELFLAESNRKSLLSSHLNENKRIK